MTPFQQSLLATENGSQRVPTVHTEGGTIPFAGYQLAAHVYALKIMALGMKMRGVTFTQIKKYYGLKGRMAKDCLPQLQAIQEKYRELSQNN
jgi:membrane protein insertase Oxa1/YidC/SpoIIIJ